MPRWNPGRVPLLRHHKPTGRAVVTLNGRDYWCGTYGTPEAAATYNAIIGRWLAGDRQPTEPATAPTVEPIRLTVGDLVRAHQRHADAYYRDADGNPTPEASNVKLQLRVLLDHVPRIPVEHFGPKALKDVRNKMVAMGWCRTHVNRAVRTVRRCWRWAVEEELIDASLAHALAVVTPLKYGRTSAPETDPVEPIDDETVEQTLAHLPPTVAAMVRPQRLHA